MKFLQSPFSEFLVSRTAHLPPPQLLQVRKGKALWPTAPLGFRYRIIKRLLDIILTSFFFIFILSWLIPILVFMNWIDGNVPIFFVQKRVGFNNRLFFCYKLRSIRKDKAESISPWAHFIRCHKLDELPQFMNVLKGEMSIVGPRPHMMSDHKAFSRAVGKGYFDRHRVLPGITGLAQVNGFEGPITSLDKLQGRLQYDLLYIEEWSLWLDVKIMMKTLCYISKGLIRKTK
ncbi:MAG: sugar transferase [Saprospiraceae bacterium]